MANPIYKTPPSNRLTVSSLLSPPEMKRSESFGSAIPPSHPHTPSTSFNSEPSKPSMTDRLAALQAPAIPSRDAYASPPISPYDPQSQKENVDCEESRGVRDPQLFVPSDAASSIALDEPLFPQDQSDPVAQRVISQHMESPDFAKLPSKPSREDYELTANFVSTVFRSYNENPRAWYQQERAFEGRYGRPSGIQKRPPLKKLAPAPTTGQRRPKVPLPRVPRAPRAPKRTPQQHVYDSFEQLSLMPASPKPARPATNRDDTDYNSLPDYSPPLDTLPKGNSKILKADWKGNILELSADPDRHLLHEAELNLASTLRLTCATYLCSKRRIFQARIETLRIGKEFRKTDAQQACKIDVNKASKLWQAYEKVGWFKADYFRNYV
ncbi:hypothetical protein EJ04DRAFT_250786 [Polyplosphaeria fusca]|uniref:SWIRM domain-containing protein n=1 Tax=Polyplosphaeria fusca TaxID=682080 RepID=A0A9P4V2H7_9PLEO|nr:hypothetical protein EJ04DRAFT_250786 [Polyplosphaeria fusca]